MIAAERDSLRFQAPVDVCPFCKRVTEFFRIFCDGHALSAHRCREHGDVVPMRSAVRNEDPILEETS